MAYVDPNEVNPGLLGLIEALAPYQQPPAVQDPYVLNPSGPNGSWTPEDYLRAGGLGASRSQAQSEAELAELRRQAQGIGVRTQNIRNAQSGIIQGQADLNNRFNQQTQGLVDQLGSARTTANNFDMGALAGYQGALGGYNRSNTAALGSLQDLYGQLGNPLQAQTRWEGDLVSQAAQAYADPNSIAAQNQALGFLGGAMNGSLNYTSQAAGAYADPNAIAAEWSALRDIQNAAAGGLDVQSQAAQAYADQGAIDMQSQGLSGLWRIANGSLDRMPWNVDPQSWNDLQKAKGQYQDVYGGSLDVKPGDLNPEAFAAQNEALAKYKALTDPKLTDAERFIYENERLMAERDERANREAVMSSLRQRGMGGSGMELTNTALANQQISQNRLLGDLGANAQAINRSMQALQGYGGLSSTMSDQANALGTANANRRTAALSGYGDIVQGEQALASEMANANANRQMQAMGLYTDQAGRLRSQTFDEAFARGSAADQVAMSNMNRQLQAMGMSFDAAGTIRDQSFNEEYSRGLAADQASANNQRTQLQGGIAYGDLASTQRQQSFNEAYSRGAAADQTAQFNREQSLGVSMFRDKFAQAERDAQWDRGLGMTNTTLRTNEANALNDTRSWEAGFKTNEAGYNRNRDVLTAQDTANNRAYQGQSHVFDSQLGLGNQMVGDEETAWGRNSQLTGLGIGVRNTGDAARERSNTAIAGGMAAGSAASDAAKQAEAARKAEARKGLLGTGIGGSRDPFMPTNWFNTDNDGILGA